MLATQRTTKYIQMWRHAGGWAPTRVLHLDRQTDAGTHAWWWQDTTGVDVWTGQKMAGRMEEGDGMKRHRWGERRTGVGRAAWPAGLKRNRVQVQKWRDVSGDTRIVRWPQSIMGLKGKFSQNEHFPNPQNHCGVSQGGGTKCTRTQRLPAWAQERDKMWISLWSLNVMKLLN